MRTKPWNLKFLFLTFLTVLFEGKLNVCKHALIEVSLCTKTFSFFRQKKLEKVMEEEGLKDEEVLHVFTNCFLDIASSY